MLQRASRITVPALLARKGRERLVMVTAYDSPTAQLLEEGGVDLLLVGDSLGMVVLGHETTLEVTMEDMLHHTRAAARGSRRALLVADMPYLSYHVSREEAVRNAGRLVQAGAQSVKVEGGIPRLAAIEAILNAEIPVMGHIGLTPQSYHRQGGFKVQGRGEEAVGRLLADARALAQCGVWSIVLEGMPADTARRITEAVEVPTIGIGAGPHCDGQVLVWHDLMGLGSGVAPRFVRRYGELGRQAIDAAARFVSDVRSGAFPSAAESYPERVESPERG